MHYIHTCATDVYKVSEILQVQLINYAQYLLAKAVYIHLKKRFSRA